MNAVFPERMLIKVHNDRFRQMFLCRIALNYRMEVNLELWMHSLPKWKQRSIVSNSDQLFSPAWAIIDAETCTSSRSFRFTELSQSI